MCVNILPKVVTQWNSGTTRDSNRSCFGIHISQTRNTATQAKLISTQFQHTNLWLEHEAIDSLRNISSVYGIVIRILMISFFNQTLTTTTTTTMHATSRQHAETTNVHFVSIFIHDYHNTRNAHKKISDYRNMLVQCRCTVQPFA